MKIRTRTPHTVNITGTDLLSLVIVGGILCAFMLVAMLSGCSSATASPEHRGLVRDSCPTVACAALLAVSR